MLPFIIKMTNKTLSNKLDIWGMAYYGHCFFFLPQSIFIKAYIIIISSVIYNDII